jgi:hypothetical protein
MIDPDARFHGAVSAALAALALLASPAGAAQAASVAQGDGPQAETKRVAARVTAVTGQAVVTGSGAAQRAMRPGDPVYEGETVHTADGARVQLRMADDSDMHVRQRTEVTVKSYRRDAGGTEPGNAIVELLTGGLRVVTGLIGKGEGDSYQVRTPTGTLGIRGTDYVLVVCETGDCILNDFAPAMPYTPGVYTGTVFGAVVVENQTGRHSIPRNGVYKIDAADTDPQGISNPPVFYSGSMSNASPGVSCWRGGRMQPCPSEFEVATRR